MKKVWLVIFSAVLVNAAVYAQETDAPDQNEPVVMEAEATNATVTKEKEVIDNAVVTEEKELTSTKGVVYRSGQVDYVSPDVLFEINATDEGSGVKNIWIVVDNASFGVYNQAVNIPNEGKHIIAYKVEDQVGNISSVKNYEFVVDTTAPEVIVRTQEKGVLLGDSLYISASNKLVLLAQDKLSGVASVEYQLDGGVWQKYSAAIASGLSNGLHKLQYRATDNVGNISLVKSFMVFVDNGAPIVSITVDPDVFVNQDKIYASPEAIFTLSGVDNETRVEYMVYDVDGGESIKYSQGFRLTPGVHTINAQAVDILGNESAVVSMTIEIDGDEPKGSLIPSK